MNIYAYKGDRVIYDKPKNGSDSDKKKAKKHLVEGTVYTIDRTEVDTWHTEVYLQEIPGQAFNSVFFSDDKTAPKHIPPEVGWKLTRIENHYDEVRSKSAVVIGAKPHPHIPLNTTYVGNFVTKCHPVIGESIIFLSTHYNGEPRTKLFRSTPVVDIKGNLYYTKNSVYQIEKIA